MPIKYNPYNWEIKPRKSLEKDLNIDFGIKIKGKYNKKKVRQIVLEALDKMIY